MKIDTEKLYPQLLDKAAGQAILFIKRSGDSFYKQFLNNYGDLTYSLLVVKGSDDLFYKIDWNGGATPTHNRVTTETTGSVHARGKRPCNGNQFIAQQRNTIFLPERNGVFDFCTSLIFWNGCW